MQSTTIRYGQLRQRRWIQLTGRTPHPTQGSTPWAPRIAKCNAGCKSQDLLHSVSRERATFGMSGQRTACVATQGINEFHEAIFAWHCVFSDYPLVLWWLSPGERRDAVTRCGWITVKRGQLLKIKAKVSSILAKGCILMTACVRVCFFYLT